MRDIEKQIEELERIAAKAKKEMEWDQRLVTVTDFLTEEQVTACLKAGGVKQCDDALVSFVLSDGLSGSDLTSWILKNVIEPNMPAINEKIDLLMQSRGLGSQSENDPRYMAYAVTYFVEQMKQFAR